MELPSQLKVGTFADARIKEIVGLSSVLAQPKHGQLVSQQVPRHMRRRAVSHNPNRLPRRLRARQLAQTANERANGGTANAPKRPSRKFRRRPKNLLQEYNRRQKSHMWLETHIWHAKRFHMSTKWGYRLPAFPNDKCFRACYRATVKKCLMQDMSYYACLELSGPESALTEGLKRITSSNCGPEISSQDFIDGYHEGRAFVFKMNMFPRGAIGEVSFMWKPKSSGDRTLWLWVHPSFEDEVMELLTEVFSLTKVVTVSETKEAEAKEAEAKEAEAKAKEAEAEDPPAAKKAKKDVNAMKLATRNVPFERTPKFESKDVKMTLLKGTLNRFRLSGPLTQTILSKTLKVSEVESGSVADWWHEYYIDRLAEFKSQRELWSLLERTIPSQLPPGSVLGLTVRDPRVLLPKVRGCPTPDEFPENDSVPHFPASAANSPIWSSDVRDRVTLTKSPDQVVNDRRSKHLVPGSELSLEANESRIPVLLVQQPGSTDTGFAAGWDVIVPAGWGMPFWMGFNHRGARVGGLREASHLDFERGRLDAVTANPDSQAGRENAVAEEVIAKELYLRYPQDKRCNFNKFGIASPFRAPWKILLDDWSTHDNVLMKKTKQAVHSIEPFVQRDKIILTRWKKSLTDGTDHPDCDKSELLPVKIEISGRGICNRMSLISLPSQGDLAMLDEDDSFGGPAEPIQVDENTEARKEEKARHQKERRSRARKAKKLRAKRKLMLAQKAVDKDTFDEKKYEAIGKDLEQLNVDRKDENAEHKKTMTDKWLGEFNTVKDSCTRPVLGFVEKGDYCLRKGRYIGLGFVPVMAFKEVIETKGVVLVRETTSLQYRFAKMSVICS